MPKSPGYNCTQPLRSYWLIFSGNAWPRTLSVHHCNTTPSWRRRFSRTSRGICVLTSPPRSCQSASSSACAMRSLMDHFALDASAFAFGALGSGLLLPLLPPSRSSAAGLINSASCCCSSCGLRLFPFGQATASSSSIRVLTAPLCVDQPSNAPVVFPRREVFAVARGLVDGLDQLIR